MSWPDRGNEPSRRQFFARQERESVERVRREAAAEGSGTEAHWPRRPASRTRRCSTRLADLDRSTAPPSPPSAWCPWSRWPGPTGRWRSEEREAVLPAPRSEAGVVPGHGLPCSCSSKSSLRGRRRASCSRPGRTTRGRWRRALARRSARASGARWWSRARSSGRGDRRLPRSRGRISDAEEAKIAELERALTWVSAAGIGLLVLRGYGRSG